MLSNLESLLLVLCSSGGRFRLVALFLRTQQLLGRGFSFLRHLADAGEQSWINTTFAQLSGHKEIHIRVGESCVSVHSNKGKLGQQDVYSETMTRMGNETVLMTDAR